MNKFDEYYLFTRAIAILRSPLLSFEYRRNVESGTYSKDIEMQAAEKWKLVEPTSTHFAQFYDTVDFLLSSLTEYCREGLELKEGLLIIATESTWNRLRQDLKTIGIHATELTLSGQLKFADATSIAQKVLDPSFPATAIFNKIVDPAVHALKSSFSTVRIYGEVVNVLCELGYPTEAVFLENHWNTYLATQDSLTLMCGYSSGSFESHQIFEMQSVCCAHSSTIQKENVDTAVADLNILRRLGASEQKALSMKLAVEKSKQREAELKESIRGLTNIETFSSVNEICLTLAHKIKNPLAVIKGSSERLLMATAGEVEMSKQMIEKGAKRIDAATDDIVGFIKNILETTTS